MKYIIDHDYHIHTHLSVCSGDPEQTTQRILEFAKANHYKNICLTDHYWDETVEKLPTGWASNFYQTQNFVHICKAKPLPQAEGVDFYFGCETEMDMHFRLGVPKERLDEFAFIIVATTHMHMDEFSVSKEDYRNPERLAKLWVERIDKLLDMDLPFYKIGLAHPTCSLINNESTEAFLKTVELIDKQEMARVFKKAAQKGMGIELNQWDAVGVMKYDVVYNLFKTAKDCGCKFYLGSDAHHPKDLEKSLQHFANAIEKLKLAEEDKFTFVK